MRMECLYMTGHQLLECMFVIYIVPPNITPGTNCWALGFNNGYDPQYDVRGLKFYIGYKTICLTAISEQQIVERQQLLSSLHKRYLEALSRAPSL